MIDTKEYLSTGTKFYFTFLAIFLFIELGIILPAREDTSITESTKEAIESVEKAILFNSDLQKSLKNKLINLRQENATFAQIKNEKTKDVKAHIVKSENPNPSKKVIEDHNFKVPKEKQQSLIKELEEKQQKLSKELIALQIQKIKLKEKLESKKFTLPILNITITQRELVNLFPAFSFLGLMIVFWYRHLVTRNISEKSLKEMPVWLAPLPHQWTILTLRKWYLVNTIGTIILCIVLFFIFDFYMWTNKKSSLPEAFAINSILAFATIGTFVYIIFQSFWIDTFRKN